MLEALLDVEDLQHLLLLGELQRHVRRHGVGQAPGLLDAGERGEHLGRHLLVELHVLLELGDDRARQYVQLLLVVGLRIRQQRRIRGVVVAGVQFLDARAVDALDQHLHGAVGKLQKLQNRRDGGDAVQVVPLGIIDIGLLLRHQHDALVGAHGHIQRLDGLLAPDEQRNHHVGIDHHVTQRQHRHVLERGGNGSRGSRRFGHAQALDDEWDTARASVRPWPTAFIALV